jgi:NAD(P) transhydrogenase
VFAGADIVLKVHAPDESQVALLRADQTLVSFLWPAQNKPLIEQIAKKHVNAFGMDCVPRIRRAQTYDALSSMAKIAGYKAVREAAREFGGYFVVDGKKKKKIPPPKVLIIGAGVTGLSAIATAKEYGAIVRVFDTRLAVKEQVKAFCAEFLELNFKDEDGSGKDGYAKEMSKDYIDAEMDLIAEQAMEVDIIITTASIPGRPAPKLITKAMVESMKKGSVIVDLAADRGGNCELTKPGQLFNYNGKVKIIGYTDLPMRVPKMCSQVYANNISKLMQYIIGTIPTATGRIADVDLKDDVVR